MATDGRPHSPSGLAPGDEAVPIRQPRACRPQRCLPTRGSARRSRPRPLRAVIRRARHSTSASQNVVRPTAKPINPDTLAAVVSHARTLSTSSPRPKVMQTTLLPTVTPRSRYEVDAVLAPVHAFDLPHVWFDSRPLKLANGLHHQLGRISRSKTSLSPSSSCNCVGSGGTSNSNMNILPLLCRYSDSCFKRAACRRFNAFSPTGL